MNRSVASSKIILKPWKTIHVTSFGCLIRLPAAKLEAYRKSFKFSGGKVFDSLPHKCRAATSLDDFLKVFDELQVLVLDKLNHFNSLLKSS